MKISEFIKKLEVIKENHGDNHLRFTVRDYYSVCGEEMDTYLSVGENGYWCGLTSVDTTTTLMFHLLEGFDEKKPKITFRK
jgi:hypothetical protein